MGVLVYNGSQEFEFDDRTLAHLKMAIGMKFQRHEGLLLTWVTPPERGSGRVSIWLSPSIPLIFRFSGSRAPKLSKIWLDALLESAATPRGMLVISEQEAERMHAESVAQPGSASPERSS